MSVLLKIRLVFIFMCFGTLTAMAQEEDFIKDEGEVVEGEFMINKELEITLPPAQRIFQKVPPDALNDRETEPLQYTFKEYNPTIGDIPTNLRVLKLKNERLTTKPGNYLKVGFGNYITPYFEASLNSLPDKTGNYGVKLKHLSSVNGPVDDGNSGDSHSNVLLFGKYIGRKASIGGDLKYSRDGYHFYGYDPGTEVSKDSIKQAFNEIQLDFEMKNHDIESPIQYKLYGSVYNISDKYDASEFGFRSGINGKYKINDQIHAKLDLGMLFSSYKNPESINRSLFRIFPGLVYTTGDLMVDVGVKVVNNNDTIVGDTKTNIYPSLKAEYNILDNITAYGSIGGDTEEVTFQSMAKENPYINSNFPLIHSNNSLDFTLGVKGNLVQYLAFDVGIRSAIYKNMYFFVNDTASFNRFGVIYDHGNTTLFQVLASVSYFKSNTIGSTLALKLNGYSTGEVEKAWHKPKFELNYSFWYNFYDKVKFSADIFALGGIQTVDFRDPTPTRSTLDGAMDLNLKIEYNLSERYGAFVSVNNLLGNNYQIYNQYPTRGLLAIVGISVSF